MLIASTLTFSRYLSFLFVHLQLQCYNTHVIC